MEHAIFSMVVFSFVKKVIYRKDRVLLRSTHRNCHSSNMESRVRLFSVITFHVLIDPKP